MKKIIVPKQQRRRKPNKGNSSVKCIKSEPARNESVVLKISKGQMEAAAVDEHPHDPEQF